MLQLVRNNSPYTIIILFIFTLLVKMQALAHPQLPVAAPGYICYEGIVNACSFVLGNSAFGYTMLAVIMLFAQALLLNAIIVKYRLFSRPTFIIAYLYILLTSVHPSFSYFNPTLVHNWFYIGALGALLGLHQTTQPRKQIYNAGFLLSAMAVVHFPAVVFITLLFAALLLLRSFNAGEWIVGVMGYLTPIYFLACILFIMDAFAAIKLWPHYGFSIPGRVDRPFYLAVVISGITVLFLCGIIVLRAQILRSGVFVRRSWVTIIIAFVLSLLVAIITDIKITAGWLVLMPALSLVIAQPLNLEKSKRFSNFTFYFSLLFIIICQLV